MKSSVNQVGFLCGIIAFSCTILFVIFQLCQVLGLIIFPADEILIYLTSFAIVVPFLLEMLALHYTVAAEKKFWSHAALIFTILYAVFVSANYIVQLATVIPAKLQGPLAGLYILEQTPHSMMWNFDAVGYMFMGLAAMAAIPVFEKKGFQGWVRIGFILHALTTPLIAMVYFYPAYSQRLLIFLGLPWGITAPVAMLLLALMFRKPASTCGFTGITG